MISHTGQRNWHSSGKKWYSVRDDMKNVLIVPVKMERFMNLKRSENCLTEVSEEKRDGIGEV